MNKDALRRMYEHTLPLFGLSIGNDDFLNTYSVQQDYSRNFIPMMVAEMGVIYPTDEVLREGKWNDRVAFHPLSESATRGVSPMIISMTAAYKFKLYQNLFFAATMFCKLAKDNKDGTVKHISPDLTIALSKLPKTIDDKSIAFISKVFQADNGTDQEVVKVYLKKNGSINGTDFKRTCTIYFPLIEALDTALENKGNTVWGVQAARKSDLELFRAIMEIILPDCSDENRYAYGSFAGSAPYFDALLRGVIKVQESLNHFLTLTGKHIPDSIRSTIFADIDWIDDIQDFKTYRNILGPLRYNEGDMESEDDEPEVKSYTRHTTEDDETPDFSERAKQNQKRVNTITTKPGYGQRRHFDDTLTEAERTNPEKAEYDERRASRRNEREDRRYDSRRDDRRDDYRRDDRRYDDRRGSRRDDRDYDDRRGSRRDDRDYDDRRSSWSDRAERNDRSDRGRGRNSRRGRR